MDGSSSSQILNIESLGHRSFLLFCIFNHLVFLSALAPYLPKRHEKLNSPILNLIIPAYADTSVWTLTPVFLTTKSSCLWTLCWHGLFPAHYIHFILSKRFFPVLIYLFFPSHFPLFWSFYNLQPIEVYKDVHGRSELIGWADSQSASKERTAQNPTRQEGTGKRYTKGSVSLEITQLW